MEDNGFIYVLINPFMTGLLKVGKTNRDPKGRAEELSGATGVPTPFILAFSMPFLNCNEAEKTIHNILSDKFERVSGNREFFRAELNDAIQIILMLQKQDKKGYHPIIENISEDSTSSPDIYQKYLSIAEAYYYGKDDTLQDIKEALANYKKAADYGAIQAYYKIGTIYLDDSIGMKDLDKALDYFKKGAQKGDDACYAEMGMIYYEIKENNNSIKCFEKYFSSNTFYNIDSVQRGKYIYSFYMVCLEDEELFKRFADSLKRIASKEQLIIIHDEIKKFTYTLCDSLSKKDPFNIAANFYRLHSFYSVFFPSDDNLYTLKLPVIEKFIFESVSTLLNIIEEKEELKDLLKNILKEGQKLNFSFVYLELALLANQDLAKEYCKEGIALGDFRCCAYLAKLLEYDENANIIFDFWLRYFESDYFYHNKYSHKLFNRITAITDFLNFLVRKGKNLSSEKLNSMLCRIQGRISNEIIKEFLDVMENTINHKTVQMELISKRPAQYIESIGAEDLKKLQKIVEQYMILNEINVAHGWPYEKIECIEDLLKSQNSTAEDIKIRDLFKRIFISKGSNISSWFKITSERTLCSDGNCIGVIGPNGVCKECGKPFSGDN